MLGISVILYLLTTILIGAVASRFVGDSKDYILAGRRLPLFLASSALFATWFGSETLLGASSRFVEDGVLGVIEDPFGAALCLFLVGLFFARPLYRMNILTFGDFYRNRFGRRAEILSSVFMIPSYFGWIAAQFVALGIIFHSLADLPVSTGIFAGAGVVLIYTVIGGMWAISLTDFLQTILIVLGLAYLVWDLGSKAGGLSAVLSSVKPGFFRFFPEMNSKSILTYVAAWMTIGLGSIPQQDIFQRVMASKSEKVAVYSSLLSSFFYLSVALLPLLAVLCARKIYPEIAREDAQMILPKTVLAHTGLFTQILFFGALLSAVMSTASGAILASASVLGENVVRPFVKNPNEKTLLVILRISVVAITLVSLSMANTKSNIYELVSQASALSLVSLFVPLVAGLFRKNSTSTGAVFSMVTGFGAWLFCNILSLEVPASIPGLISSWLGLLFGDFLEKHGFGFKERT
ncbi:sodium:solute symporter family protein [Leptospira alstonii]|uniref:Transporter, SSS family n=3 Tax=Leptospira alstonii TaxID=28452 RepID=M6D5J3_9LEPT|nr:sodium:solute symporter family protein [Leptospira alstonii]EMJ96483.1 transporter, SSS family [Leptospira alstonii serovar Sichuan str. 79601]EQA79083.1 transporter, SSS family [Leptospira alstonii serovar Pingchang str. 80-412]